MFTPPARLTARIATRELLLLLAILPSQTLAQEPKPTETPALEPYNATAFPDRVILTIPGDPATTMAVTWRTADSVSKAVAQIAPDDHGPQFEAQARTLTATSIPLITSTRRDLCHSVLFNGLSPDSRYVYRVGDGSHWNEWNQFRTASKAASPFQFLFVGDAQNNIKTHWSRVIRTAFATAPEARFIVHAGDLVNRGTSDSDWGEWFQAAGWINQVVPSLPSPGNHEYSKSKEEAARGLTGITSHWRAQFALPENGPTGLEETAYFVDFQGVRIVSLNSSERQEEQAAWLDQLLEGNPNRWTIIVFHHPIYSSARNRDNIKLRRLWQPIFDRHHVDLVLQGHDHSYARSGIQNVTPEDAGGITPHRQSGAVYVNSVAGPKQYALDQKPEHKRTAEGTQLFQVVSVNAERLRLEARTARGDLYDAFELRKRPGLSNELIECGPGTPERHVRPPERPKTTVPKAAMAS